jgi:hypothetical protein
VLLSEVLGKPLVHESGEELGHVHDVRVVRVGELGQRDALRVTGVVAGPGGVGVRLGYGIGEQGGPWMLRRLFQLLMRDLRFVPWERLRIEEQRIVASGPLDALRHPSDLEDGR